MRDLSMIFARDKNGVIGNGKDLPWRSKKDMSFFVNMTKGKTVVMGRNTWESLPKKPLPNRRNIVITSRPLEVEGVDVVTLSDFVTHFRNEKDLICIGGKRLYEALLPLCHSVFVTEMSTEVPGDVTFTEEFRDFEEVMSFEEYDDSFEDPENGIRKVRMKMFMLSRPAHLHLQV